MAANRSMKAKSLCKIDKKTTSGVGGGGGGIDYDPIVFYEFVNGCAPPPHHHKQQIGCDPVFMHL